MHAVGTFVIKTWTEESYDEIDDGPKLVRASLATSFHGELEGAGDVVYLMVVAPDKTSSFIGLERVVGRIAERAGTFVFSDWGTFDGTTVVATWKVVANSGTDELFGLRGEGRFAAPLGAPAEFSFDYEFDETP